MDTLDAKRTSTSTNKMEIQTQDVASTPVSSEVDAKPTVQTPVSAVQRFRQKWLQATLSILPVYIAVHIGFFLTTCLSFLFTHRDFDGTWVPFSALPEAWHHWDTGYYMVIAKFGYQKAEQTAFFPLYGYLERAVMPLTHNNPLVAGLLISDVTGFFLLIVLYQLIREDFDDVRANRAVLYLSLFPTAFFLASGYNEALFLCLAVLSFYNMRHGQWWLAGLFGFFASLTRSAGVFLLFPFCYEYLRQHEFSLRHIRFDVVSSGLIPAGIVVYALYCYYKFHDFLAFSHAQAHWNHLFEPPWYGILGSIKAINESGGLLGFQSIRNLLDLVPDLMMLVLIVLIFVGPWRFPRSLWSYGIYAAFVYLFLQLFPIGGTGLFPLQSVGRYLLELFPAFIVLATLGKSRMFNMNYLVISGALLFFLLTQFLTGHWVL